MATACISQRCGLCGFKIQKNDRIVAVMNDGRQSGEMSYNLSMTDQYGASFEECLGACPHRGGREVGCHAMCASLVPLASRASLLKVLTYQYEPSPFEVTRRMNWFHIQFASTSPIWRHAKPHLPQELRYQIATHLLQGTALRRYTVACTRILPKDMESGSSRIRVSAEIWARFIDFEGVRYISSLSNSPDDDHAESIFAPNTAQAVDSIYVAENHLGAMQVLFCSSVKAPVVERRQGLWWRIIQLRGRCPVLVIQTDGVKLRTIMVESEEAGSHLTQSLWSVPPSEPLRLVQLEARPPAAQLSMLACNEPGIAAYSVYWNCSIMLLHAHIPGEDLTFYEGYQEGIWLHFPLKTGEKISEIWKHGQVESDLALILKTNHSRVALFGPQSISQPLPLPTLIDLPPQDRGSRFFFEHSPLGVCSLYFETPKPAPPTNSSLTLPKPMSRQPKSFSESYFYTTADLDDIEMIVPCQRYIRGKRHIIGLLLQFPEGRQSCVGQVRLDSLGGPLRADGHQSMWLGFSKSDHRPFVSAVVLSKPRGNEGISWLEIQFYGTLEWWFTLRQCQ
ncbi:hypothetical protein CT0861_12835, partial [Colletotrichum tofieldiae]